MTEIERSKCLALMDKIIQCAEESGDAYKRNSIHEHWFKEGCISGIYYALKILGFQDKKLESLEEFYGDDVEF